MVDRDNDGRVTYEEFLAAAREAREDESRAAARSMEVVEVLTRISEYMQREVREATRGLRHAQRGCCFAILVSYYLLVHDKVHPPSA